MATASEPWILLPFLSSIRRAPILTEYRHDMLVDAVEDFSKELPNGLDDYLGEMRAFVLRLYAKAASGKGNARYFVDKTPPYHHVAGELFKLFPDGKFVFLWRNPLAVAASYVETFGAGRWNLDWAGPELRPAIRRLVAAYKRQGDAALGLRYEDVLARPHDECGRLFRYLGLPYDASVIDGFAGVSLNGRLGDPSGIRRYAALSPEPLDKWKATFANPLRKAWARRFLRAVGPDMLAAMGYAEEALLADLSAAPTSTRRLGGDAVRALAGPMKRRVTYLARAWDLSS